jgi:hypothetical protein
VRRRAGRADDGDRARLENRVESGWHFRRISRGPAGHANVALGIIARLRPSNDVAKEPGDVRRES